MAPKKIGETPEGKPVLTSGLPIWIDYVLMGAIGFLFASLIVTMLYCLVRLFLYALGVR